MLHCIFQTAKYRQAKVASCYADKKKIVWSLVKNEFDWYTRIRTAEHGGKRPLFGRACGVRSEAQISGIDRDDLLYSAFVLDVIEKRCEIAVTVIQPEQGCIAVGW